jgi:hypothetical protein
MVSIKMPIVEVILVVWMGVVVVDGQLENRTVTKVFITMRLV